MYWYSFFCLCPGTYTFGYFMEICYRINFKLWMKYCACWHCYDMLLGVLTPITISVYLHRRKVFLFSNQFARSDNLSINCCVILKCIWLLCEHDNIKTIFFLYQLCSWQHILMIQIMRPYYHLFHQEKPGVFNQMFHKGLPSVAIG